MLTLHDALNLTLSGGIVSGEPAFFETGTFTSPVSTTGNQVIPLDDAIWGGQAPKVVLFFGSSSTADGIATDALMTFGVGVSSTERATVSISSKDDQATSEADRKHDQAKAILALSSSGAIMETADYVDDATGDQFTINWTISAAPEFIYGFLAIGGESVEAFVDAIVAPASPQIVAYTDVGFQPDCLISFGAAVTVPNEAVNAMMHIGFHDGTIDRQISVNSLNNLGTSNTIRLKNSKFISTLSTAELETCNVESLDSDGYSLDWTKADASSRKVTVLCIKGVQCKVITTDQTLTDTTRNTAVGFSPLAALAITHMGVGSGFVDDVPSQLSQTQSHKFDGENDQSVIGDMAELRFGSGDGSIPFWFNTRTGTTGHLIMHGHTFNTRGSISVEIVSNKVFLQIQDGTLTFDITSASNFNDGNWHWGAAIRDGNNLRLNIGGVEETPVDITGLGDIDDSAGFTIGSAKNNGFVSSSIAQVRVYAGEALSVADCVLMAAGSEPASGTIDGHWPLDGDFLDISGNANHGTFTGSVNDDSRIGIGVWSQANSDAQSFSGAVDEDGQGTTDSDRVQNSTKIIEHIDHAQTTVGTIALSASGNIVTETNASTDGTARETSYLLLR